MRWPWPRQPAETGDEQLERVGAATPERPLPSGSPADLATQLERLRQILDLVEYYFYPRSGAMHADLAAAVGTSDRALTARRVALLHEAGPASLGDLDTTELAQLADYALRQPERLARDPTVVVVLAAGNGEARSGMPHRGGS